MTLKECKELMLEMWWWLYENPEMEKEDFLKAHPKYPELLFGCAACEYIRVVCNQCPVDWWGVGRCSPYLIWFKSKPGSRSKKFAALEMIKCILRIKV